MRSRRTVQKLDRLLSYCVVVSCADVRERLASVNLNSDAGDVICYIGNFRMPMEFSVGTAVIVDGMLYTNSGYGQFGSAPGNVFLAFGLAKSVE